jgi:hypothetical protein
MRHFETTERSVLITAVSHRRMPDPKNLVGQVAPQALPDSRKHLIYESVDLVLFEKNWNCNS